MSAEYFDAASAKTYRERYTYTSDGYLQDMFLSTWNGSAFVEQSQAAASRSTDLAGRVVAYAERNADNSVRTNLARSFDRDSRQTQEVDYTKVHNGQYKTDTHAYNADGSLASISRSNVATTMTLSYAYQWWDSAKQTEIKIKAVNDAAPGWAPGPKRSSMLDGPSFECHREAASAFVNATLQIFYATGVRQVSTQCGLG